MSHATFRTSAFMATLTRVVAFVALGTAMLAATDVAHASPLCSDDESYGAAEDGAEAGDRVEGFVDGQVEQAYSIGVEEASIQIEEEAKTFLRSMGERFTVLAPYLHDGVWLVSLAAAIRDDIVNHHIVFRRSNGVVEISFFDATQSEVLHVFAQLVASDLGTDLGAFVGEILLPGIGGFIGAFIGGIAGWELGGAFEHWLAKKFDPPAIPALVFSANGPIAGKYCTGLYEDQDAPWNNNFLCSDVNLGLEFHSGRLHAPNKECVSMFEPGEAAYWNDNYLCWNDDLGYSLIWSPTGEPGGATERHCARIVDTAEPTYWRDDYVCAYRTEDPAPTVNLGDSPLGPVSPASQLTNLAFGRHTTQSSTDVGGDPRRAVDGITNGEWHNASVTHTGDETSPWWKVDLAGTETITEVIVHNRTDCCTERLSDFDVELLDAEGQVVASEHLAGAAPTVTTVRFNAIEAQFVRVRLAGTNPLSLAEVIVHGDAPYARPSNLAWGKPAIQSTTSGAGAAGLASDGVTNGVFADGSVTHTEQQAKPWWQVDLLGMHDITEVRLFNRTDCCSARLANFQVDLLDEAGTLVARRTHVPAVGTEISLAFASKRARFVRVQLVGTGFLSLAEVVVLSNLALSQQGTQSSVASGAVAMRALDGNPSGVVAHASMAQTNVEPNPYWQVDLATTRDLAEVALWGPDGTMLSDVVVQVRDQNGSVVRERRIGSFTRSTRVDLAGTRGRYVRVERRGPGALALAEVEVFDGRRPTINDVIGNFQRLPVENGWHDGFITYDGADVRWENEDGVGWSLAPMLGVRRLATANDCPYYDVLDRATRSFDLQTSSAGVVTGFIFLNELYTRALSVEDVIGRYQRLPVQNNTQDGRIMMVNGVLRWKNKNGSNWLLTPQFGQTQIMTPSGNPFRIQRDAGAVTGFRFNNELYVRMAM